MQHVLLAYGKEKLESLLLTIVTSREKPIKNFLLFLAEKYPILYDYHCKVAGNDWLDHCIQYVVDHCGEYLTQWVPAEEYHLSWQLEEMAIYPLADFILKDDGAWEDFVDFFTSEKETASGTPYIDCYDIRELFENGDV